MKKLVLFMMAMVTSAAFLTSCNSKADFEPNEQDEKIAEYKNTEKYISVNELESIVGNDDVVVFGVINTTNVTVKNIDGAYLVWRGDYSGKSEESLSSTDVGGVRLDQGTMETILSKAGVEKDTTVVVYASDSHHDAARFAWQVETLGHENVRILDGGINAWTGAGKATGSAKRISDVNEDGSGYKAPNYDASLAYASTEMVVEALNNPDEWVVIDTRSESEATGADTKGGAFGKGYLEGAVHIEWTEAQDEETLLKKVEELEGIYGDFKDKKIITFCQSGVRSAHTYEVLANALGYEAYNYDGSWIEWSYAASSASEGVVDAGLKTAVLELTGNWEDFGKAK